MKLFNDELNDKLFNNKLSHNMYVTYFTLTYIL